MAQSPKILMGVGHIPLFAFGPEATRSEQDAAIMMSVVNERYVPVIRFDLDDPKVYSKNVVQDETPPDEEPWGEPSPPDVADGCRPYDDEGLPVDDHDPMCGYGGYGYCKDCCPPEEDS